MAERIPIGGTITAIRVTTWLMRLVLGRTVAIDTCVIVCSLTGLLPLFPEPVFACGRIPVR